MVELIHIHIEHFIHTYMHVCMYNVYIYSRQLINQQFNWPTNNPHFFDDWWILQLRALPDELAPLVDPFARESVDPVDPVDPGWSAVTTCDSWEGVILNISIGWWICDFSSSILRSTTVFTGRPQLGTQRFSSLAMKSLQDRTSEPMCTLKA